MSLPIEIQQVITKQLKPNSEIISVENLSGGSINSAAKVVTNAGNIFIKWNNNAAYPFMFKREKEGLELLKETNTIKIPDVLLEAETSKYAFLMLEWMEKDSPENHPDFWTNFAHQLAELHRCTSSNYGLLQHNYMGSLIQYNTNQKYYSSFYHRQRLLPQIELAQKKKLLSPTLLSKFEKLFEELKNIIPEEEPALVHGDLWSGNFLCSKDGSAAIFDPAVHYGHREFDLAMSKLFGGFPESFYSAYEEDYPLEVGWESRIVLFQLYPLLVHLNIFGLSYLGDIEKAISKYI